MKNNNLNQVVLNAGTMVLIACELGMIVQEYADSGYIKPKNEVDYTAYVGNFTEEYVDTNSWASIPGAKLAFQDKIVEDHGTEEGKRMVKNRGF